MGILDWITQSAQKLKDVESQIHADSQDAYEVYQRNIVLEREIAQRTEELRLANQTLLTLEQVWDMMNSSRPLSSVLETIVSRCQRFDLRRITTDDIIKRLREISNIENIKINVII